MSDLKTIYELGRVGMIFPILQIRSGLAKRLGQGHEESDLESFFFNVLSILLYWPFKALLIAKTPCCSILWSAVILRQDNIVVKP